MQLALMNKALGHPVRLEILRTLIERKACIAGDLVAEFPLAQSTVSEHLRVLKEAGLIQGEIEGPRTSYCVRPEGLASLKAGMDALLNAFFVDPSCE
jgi:ArsR family transcriptional regulator